MLVGESEQGIADLSKEHYCGRKMSSRRADLVQATSPIMDSLKMVSELTVVRSPKRQGKAG